MALRRLLVPASIMALVACGGGGPPSGQTNPAGSRASASPSESPSAPTSSSPQPGAETLAFIRDGDIWLVGADGTGEQRLGLHDVRSFDWRTAGDIDVAVGSNPTQHVVVDVDGTQHPLSYPAGGSWSPHGAFYAVVVDQNVELFDTAGTNIAELVPGPGEEQCGAPPPDVPRLRLGRPAFTEGELSVLIAVACWKDTGAYNVPATVYEAVLDGGVIRPIDGLTTNLRQVTAPLVSPDGTGIAQSEVGGSSLCPVATSLRVKRGDQEPVVVTDGLFAQVTEGNAGRSIFGGVAGYDWSPDSDSLVVSFNVWFCDLQTGAFDLALAGLYALVRDGPPEELLLQGQTHDPAWSPSGASIAYVSGDGRQTPEGEIMVLDFDTGGQTSLGVGSAPAWQPPA